MMDTFLGADGGQKSGSVGYCSTIEISTEVSSRCGCFETVENGSRKPADKGIYESER